MEGAFTPKPYAGIMSPSPNYGQISGIGGESARYSPGYSLAGSFPPGKSPAYAARSPHIGYSGTGYYSGSPVGAG